jgi:asparagine synthase (glutamine-hydrolysing)
MGFPVPLKEWFKGPLNEFVSDIYRSQKAKHRPFLNSDLILTNLAIGSEFSRKTWSLLSLELWHRRFHDKTVEYRAMANG